MSDAKIIAARVARRVASLSELAPLWLIIDAAACPEPMWFAQGIGAKAQTLFKERDSQLIDAAPWLINVADNLDLITQCIKHDPLGHACLWFNARDEATLHYQLQQRLYATTHDGTETRFRFYDPRVLHLYLNDITPERKLALLAPFTSLFYADINPFYTDRHWLSWQVTDTDAIPHTVPIKES